MRIRAHVDRAVTALDVLLALEVVAEVLHAFQAGAVALLYLAIRQLEDQLVMPLVVGRAVHVHPLVTIFAVVAGEHLAGPLGALLAVPLAAAAKVVLDYAYPAPRVSEG